MSPRRILAVTKRILFGLLHEPRTLVLVFLAPVLSMFVFGLVFSGRVMHVRVVVVDLDRGASAPLGGAVRVSQDVMRSMDREVLEIQTMESESDAVREVEAGRASAVIVFPEGFSASVVAGVSDSQDFSPSSLVVRLDRTVYEVAGAVSQAVQNAVLEALELHGQRTPVRLDTGSPIYGAHAQFMDFFLPGIVGFSCFFLTTLLTILSFVGERRAGTLERLLTTPLRGGEIVAGYALLYGGIGVAQSGLLVLIATAIFRITVVGSVGLAFVTVALLSVVSLSLGILLSILARTELQAVQMIPLIVLPTFLLSGIFWPVEAMPLWLRPVPYFIPPYYAIDAWRSILVRGWGLDRVWPELAALVGFALLFLVGSAFALRRRRG